MAKKKEKKRKENITQEKVSEINSETVSDSDSDKQTVSEKSSFSQLDFLKPFLNKTYIEIAILVIIVLIGMSLRVQDLYDWQKEPDRAFYNGEPLFINFDSYFYLSLARDIVEGNHDKTEEKRDVPIGVERRFPPPLLSVLTAFIKKITPFSYMWIAVFIPVFLGPLISIPIFYLGRHYGGASMGTVSALFSVISYYYIYRSNIGWYDTDCLNVTLTVLSVLLALMFAINKGKTRYAYFAAIIINYLFFLLWWDSTPEVVTVVSLTPFLTALLFFYRPSKKEALIFFSILSMPVLILLLWKGLEIPMRIINGIKVVFTYISVKETVDIWPSIGATVAEQKRPELMELIVKSAGHPFPFYIGLIGLVLLLVKKSKEGLLLFVPVVLGALSVFYAKRFIIFMVPVIALGVGFFISFIWSYKKKFKFIYFVTPILVFLLVYPSLVKVLTNTFFPPEDPPLIMAFDEAGKRTEANAVIWAWWDHGYPLLFWANRGTIGDGTLHGGERSAYNALPFVTDNFRLSANFISFYIAHGIPGIHKFYKAYDNVPEGYDALKELLAAGPDKTREKLTSSPLKPVDDLTNTEKWLKFLFPGETLPTYILLDKRLLQTAYWWFWLGTWDPSKKDGIHPYYYPLFNIKRNGDNFETPEGLSLDLRKGVFFIENKQAAIKSLLIVEPPRPNEINFGRQEGSRVEIIPKFEYGAIMDEPIARSVFNQIFLRLMVDKRFFEPVIISTPFFQIWKVKGDVAQ